MEILGIGMSMIDSFQVVEEFPSSTGVTEVSESVLMGGGPVPTALCAAAKLGSNCGIIDRIGDDWCGNLIREEYSRLGVNTDFLRQEPGRNSSLGTVLVRRRDGERHIVFRRGNFTDLTPGELPRAVLKNCRFLHLNGRHWPACLEAARIVSEAGGMVSFDGGAHRYRVGIEPLLERADLLIVAAEFAERLARTTNREKQLRSLACRGARLAGVTDGAKGSWFLTCEGEFFQQPAFPVNPIVDTTGCGDVFHGAFLAALARGEDWRSCARFASAAAAISATALGGRGNLPSREQVAEMTLRN